MPGVFPRVVLVFPLSASSKTDARHEGYLMSNSTPRQRSCSQLPTLAPDGVARLKQPTPRRTPPAAPAPSALATCAFPATLQAEGAHEVELAQRHAALAQNVVGGGRVEMEVRQGEGPQAPFGGEHPVVLAGDAEGHILALPAIDLGGA